MEGKEEKMTELLRGFPSGALRVFNGLSMAVATAFFFAIVLASFVFQVPARFLQWVITGEWGNKDKDNLS
jgi:hypothetical protein